jgi:predicted metal-dependent phosphoesterase TrpH
MSWTLVVHVHTRNSYDSLNDPRALVKRAVERGVDVLAVTDHDTWKGGVDTLQVVSKTGARLRVILAAEFATDQGDVIGLFIKDEPRERSALKVCDAIHEQGGLVLLPHPYRWHRLDEPLLSRVDLVEVFNSRTSRADNARAAELAKARGLPELVGPDAHRVWELDLARVVFEGDLPADEEGLKHALLHAPRRLETRSTSIWAEWWSQAVKCTRRPSGRLAWAVVRGALRRIVKPGAYDYDLR